MKYRPPLVWWRRGEASPARQRQPPVSCNLQGGKGIHGEDRRASPPLPSTAPSTDTSQVGSSAVAVDGRPGRRGADRRPGRRCHCFCQSNKYEMKSLFLFVVLLILKLVRNLQASSCVRTLISNSAYDELMVHSDSRHRVGDRSTQEQTSCGFDVTTGHG